MKSGVTVEEWVARFRAIGLDEAAMDKWHCLFERENPAGHQSFLEWLGLPPRPGRGNQDKERLRR